MTGKVTARFKDVSLDTLLGMVCSPPFQRLGLDSRINGLAIANWTNGVAENVSVGAASQPDPSRAGFARGSSRRRHGGCNLYPTRRRRRPAQA